MKIVVCVKHVPDPNYPMRVDAGTKRLVRDPAQSILDPADEFGLEIALKAVEEHGGEVVALTMGPAPAEDALRRAMAMGAERAIQLIDDGLAGSDALTTARALAAAIKGEAPDVVVCAVESTDAYTGMVPGALAELLDLPQLTFARSVTLTSSEVTVERVTEAKRHIAVERHGPVFANHRDYQAFERCRLFHVWRDCKSCHMPMAIRGRERIMPMVMKTRK